MPKSSHDQSIGVAVVLLIVLAVLVALGSAFFYSRLWRNTSNTSRPITTVVKPKIVNQVGNTNADQVNEVSVTTPSQNTLVSSPISITGSAPGTWYFEASFPVRLEDLEGNILAQSYAQAVGEWMTQKQVEFTSMVEYSVSTETEAVLIFQPDDPAGLGVTEEYRHPVVLLP